MHVFCGASGTSRRHDQTHDLLIWHAQPMGTVTAHTSFPLRHSMPRRMVSPPRLELRDRRSPFGVWSTSGHVNVRGSSSRWDTREAGRGAATCAASRFRRRADSLQSRARVATDQGSQAAWSSKPSKRVDLEKCRAPCTPAAWRSCSRAPLRLPQPSSSSPSARSQLSVAPSALTSAHVATRTALSPAPHAAVLTFRRRTETAAAPLAWCARGTHTLAPSRAHASAASSDAVPCVRHYYSKRSSHPRAATTVSSSTRAAPSTHACLRLRRCAAARSCSSLSARIQAAVRAATTSDDSSDDSSDKQSDNLEITER